MMTLVDVIDAARDRTKAASYRELAKRLDMPESYMATYRTGRAMPSDEAMLKLSEAAGIDPNEALLMLNIWRAKSPAARRQWEKMLATISAAAAALLITSYSPSALSGRAEAAPPISESGATINIMRRKLIRAYRWLSATLTQLLRSLDTTDRRFA